MMTVDAVRNVITHGTMMGEEGESYEWAYPGGTYGDFSAESAGYIQGYRERCKIEILLPAELDESRGGEVLLYVAGEGGGLTAQEAIDMGFARLVPGG